jgi:phage terminase small subunit
MSRKLTSKQEAYKNNRIAGMGVSESYRAAYDVKKMSPTSVSVAANKLEKDDRIAIEIQIAKESAAERALVTTEDVVKGLLVEAQCNGEGSSQSARVAAWKALSDFTGGFDTNKQKVQQEVTGKDGKPIENKFTVEFVNAAPKS